MVSPRSVCHSLLIVVDNYAYYNLEAWKHNQRNWQKDTRFEANVEPFFNSLHLSLTRVHETPLYEA